MIQTTAKQVTPNWQHSKNGCRKLHDNGAYPGLTIIPSYNPAITSAGKETIASGIRQTIHSTTVTRDTIKQFNRNTEFHFASLLGRSANQQSFMALLLDFHDPPHTRIAVWQIEEPLEFFINQLVLLPNDRAAIEKLRKPERQLQWFASRWLLRYMIAPDKPIEVATDAHGKQMLINYRFEISLSHTRDMVTAMLSPYACGLDAELKRSRIQVLAHRFLHPDELSHASQFESDYTVLYAYWCAKEALYKLYSKRRLQFNRDLYIRPFSLENKGSLTGEIRLNGATNCYRVHYLNERDYFLAWVTADDAVI
jgi:phosphopantetheinyl transferase (holo-ACP synthase)